jgi:two-component system, NtrC family, sensor kinase
MKRERDPMGKAQGAAEPEREGQRTSVSGLVLPEEQASASHTIQLAEVPSRQLDRLLVLGNDLPVTEGEDTLLQAFVDALAALVPGHAVAVIVGEGDGRKSFRSDERAQRTSHTSAPPSREVEKVKLFSQHPIERAVRMPETDAVLFVASDDATLASDAAPAVQLAHRALFVLESARERMRMREQLSQLNAMLVQSDKLASFGQLAAGMVHEINNPLTSIIAYSDFLAKRAIARQDSEDVERLRRIGESAQRMLKLSRDIVSYARPSPATEQPVVLSSVIDQAFAFCEHLFEANGVKVDRTFGDGVLPVRGRPEQLAQVFVNLFTNACHAMPEKGGHVYITTELSPDEARVKVTVGDNGHGISQSNLDRIFQPFFTTKDERQGTGLGLAIVKRIVESHNGRVDVSSSSSGTRFVIWLPAATE